MKARIGLTLAIIFALASLTAVVPKALAGDHDWEGPCSVKLLEGAFGYNTDGLVLFVPAPPPLIGNFVPFGLVGTMSFDGKGNLQSLDFLNVGYGAYQRTGTGTYEVDATSATAGYCAFTATWNLSQEAAYKEGLAPAPTLTIHLYMVLARHGTVLKLLNTDAGYVVACSWDKQ